MNIIDSSVAWFDRCDQLTTIIEVVRQHRTALNYVINMTGYVLRTNVIGEKVTYLQLSMICWVKMTEIKRFCQLSFYTFYPALAYTLFLSEWTKIWKL